MRLMNVRAYEFELYSRDIRSVVGSSLEAAEVDFGLGGLVLHR